jgi:hypothetical protein
MLTIDLLSIHKAETDLMHPEGDMRIWFRIWKNAHLVRQTVIERNEDDTRTHKVLGSLEDACHEFDLDIPIWLDKNVKEFKRSSKTRFTADCFISEIDFDHLEMSVLEEDI